MLTDEQKERLLEIARNTIETYIIEGKKPEIVNEDPVLNQKRGAFVTLHKNSQLRGCIGNIVSNQELFLTIRDMAIEASTGDPRFPRVSKNELKDIDIEISVLSPLKQIQDLSEMELGVHGVLIRKGMRSGVFLPQVATETGWTKEEFMETLCNQKAGLPPDAWKDPDVEIYIFSAEVFKEK